MYGHHIRQMNKLLKKNGVIQSNSKKLCKSPTIGNMHNPPHSKTTTYQGDGKYISNRHICLCH